MGFQTVSNFVYSIIWAILWNRFVKLLSPMAPMSLTGNFSLAPMAVIGANERQLRHSNGAICTIVGANDRQWYHLNGAIGGSDSGAQ